MLKQLALRFSGFIIAIALPLSLPVASYAAKPNTQRALPVCDLVTPKQLQALGFEPVGKPSMSTGQFSAEQSGAPSDVNVALCFFYADVVGSRRTFSITVERFGASEGLAAWFAKKSRDAEADATLISKIDQSTCEKGSYQIEPSKPSETVGENTQLYVACDQLIGSNRINLSFETSEGNLLPSFSDVKTLLDQALKNLPKPAR